eukprot:TRINITY_DN3590_c1_g1_i2.p1 TRINITY_DN3590_c1_g1~~TRINITY_DN3590_c1_g1_i2.p1  ORF type:complete len:932 (+),score=317.67 TRINITY_DN3590_c1_g1_i2:115-2910(+)
MSSVRLRDLIKSVRNCKTAAEERAAIAKECAVIREIFRDDNPEYRHRNVAKLLYIHMLGYPSHFGQMECLKLIASPHYSDKRIGYLGIMLLLDEKHEVLMLATHSMKSDLNHPNQYVVGLALCAIANISSQEIARDVAADVLKLLTHSNPYIRKKAAVTAIRVLRKCPEIGENFVPKVKTLIGERNHGVLMTGVSLIIELCNLDEANIDGFRPLVPALVRALKQLAQSGYAPEYDVQGITDPFLQVKILRLLRVLGKGSPESSEAMNELLAQIATNTESMRNVGNAILYECVMTIMSIEAEAGLRVLGINLLARFLGNKDNNVRYVALNTLSQVSKLDIAAVQKHRNTIVQSLRKDTDISIRRRALELIYALIDRSNISELIPELMDFLVVSDIELRPSLIKNICLVSERYSPSKKYYIDTILKVMLSAPSSGTTSIKASAKDKEAGANKEGGSSQNGDNYVFSGNERILGNFLKLIVSSDEDIQEYAAKKLYTSLQGSTSKAGIISCSQQFVTVAVWTIGEYADLLLSGTKYPPNYAAAEVVGIMEYIIKDPNTESRTKQYVVQSLLKMTERLASSGQASDVARVEDMIREWKTSLNVEIQQRACEYDSLVARSDSEDLKHQVLQHLPPPEDLPAASSTNNGDDQGPVIVEDEINNLIFSPDQERRPGGGGAGANNNNSSSNNNAGKQESGSKVSLIDQLFGGPSTGGGSSGGGGGSTASLMDLLSGPSPSSGMGGGGGLGLGLGGGMGGGMGGGGGLGDIYGAGIGSPTGSGGFPGMNGGGGGLSPTPLSGGLAGLGGLGGLGGGAVMDTTEMKAVEKGGIVGMFGFRKKEEGGRRDVEITMNWSNTNRDEVRGFVVLVAVPKYITPHMENASGNVLPAMGMGRVTQKLTLDCSNAGGNPLGLMLKMQYEIADRRVEEMVQVSKFPQGF